jgi:hypothetical protein
MQQMGKKWYEERTIDTLMRTLDRHTSKALCSALLAGVSMIATLFRLLIAIVQSLGSGSPAKLSTATGWFLVCLALVSIILSFMGLIEATTKLWAWRLLCSLSIVALVSSVTAALAGAWLIQLYANAAHLPMQ